MGKSESTHSEASSEMSDASDEKTSETGLNYVPDADNEASEDPSTKQQANILTESNTQESSSEEAEEENVDANAAEQNSSVIGPSETDLVWEVIYNAKEDEVGVDYLLDKSIPWSQKKAVMVFQLPDVIGLERKEENYVLQPLEKAQIIRDIICHLRKIEVIAKTAPAPNIWFRGAIIYIECRSYFMAERLLQQPPCHKGFPMDVISKPFKADFPEAHIYRFSYFKSSASLKQLFAKYVGELSKRLNTDHLIALAQYYAFDNGLEDERVFTGTLVLFAGRRKSGPLPLFENISPEKVEYKQT
ncbi:uncharacterized protein UTRI_10420 [Ustilago trichophora]|uniref:Uncharacterized protein n=1 Tax=Ustilago trichophora TaxID=86804 RepID=A0A5C3E9D8_9BASI|nr:uncharacterized protein UTRI_10420 [Ustilago trichophora]